MDTLDPLPGPIGGFMDPRLRTGYELHGVFQQRGEGCKQQTFPDNTQYRNQMISFRSFWIQYLKRLS